MRVKLLSKCPVCGSGLEIVRLRCPSCKTTIENSFEYNKFMKLTDEQLQFVEMFLKARGNFKEMERELGLSYPTLRARLESILEVLGLKDSGKRQDTIEVLEMLERGEISPDEAIKILKEED
ncbi:hypothetical protein B0S90_0505 [Caldicellulosiruptor bescii]|uniref:DUF2089 domain-containing protein n=2 Tax=Caldicellulosiruptor bescii TaxID=31899 RepID=B9MMF3_CALBD|nr:DUF2089 domain-containing protein [Caldicellulosiruptor bescii]ACM59385.1 conserved hypothetical protein [Caldicellulosiruptor bescii DSM 6725]PBC88158.1 hypothetical protein B0S87_1120 [Caldicellulosiruptor bescii]PBC89747.1 hypothetical protein B0S89_0009 [Caldicellulosiruptor bescii]PBD04828.1 hypothetical protein B0S85_2536 [Caldicellulosiruptor bescii]PBD05542.1 hypothetical protein B0S90_0505 [Caldicellulosiruptor bescii]